MSAKISYRACYFLNELINHNPEEDLNTTLTSAELKEKICAILEYSSYTTVFTFFMYLKGKGLIVQNGDICIFNKEKARRFIKENDPFIKKKRTKDKKLKGWKNEH